MLAKARKSSFNANIGEFCSVTFVCLFVCLFVFLWRLKLLGYISNSGICDYKVRKESKVLVYTAYEKCSFDFRLVILTNEVS